MEHSVSPQRLTRPLRQARERPTTESSKAKARTMYRRELLNRPHEPETWKKSSSKAENQPTNRSSP